MRQLNPKFYIKKKNLSCRELIGEKMLFKVINRRKTIASLLHKTHTNVFYALEW